MKDLRPLIGISCRHDVSPGYGHRPINAQSDSYLQAISQAGGIPFLIPLELDVEALRVLYDLATGILLTGGGDIDPTFYNSSPQAKLSDIQADRDQLEITLTRWAVADGKPILGICRGIQVMAVAVGGTLYQDLPTQKPEADLHTYNYNPEKCLPYDQMIHTVNLTSECRLAQIVGADEVWVNSLHHQAVKDLPKPYQVVGYSSDGIVEVIESQEHPFFCGVQWHPEVMIKEHETARSIFSGFIQICREAATKF